MNILILSVGSRNKIIQYFKKELGKEGKVIAADCSLYAPALYEADQYFIVPRINDEGYLDEILKICKENRIDYILSLIDPELTIISENKNLIEKTGAKVIVSGRESIKICFDKYWFYRHLVQHQIETIPTYDNLDSFNSDLKKELIFFPVFVKPRCGSASINISKVNDYDTLASIFNQIPDLIIQKFCEGKEYGIDAYFDLDNHNLVDIFIKEKVKMRAGETDKSISVKNEGILATVNRLGEIFNFSGPIDMDIFIDGESIIISEINPRFGGGYPHAYECGVNFPRRIIEKSLEQYTDYPENVIMMKYNEVKIVCDLLV